MTPDYVLIDTDTMPVEEDPRNPGKLTQLLLSRDDTGGGVVRISHWPAGFTEKIRAMADNGHRHYHRSVNERHYVLGGDWTSLYWPDRESGPEATRMVRHHYLENPPMTLHGIRRDLGPETGTKFLVWTSGPGTDVHEPEAKFESIDVDFAGRVPEGIGLSPIMFNARDRAWSPHPEHDGWLTKELSPPVTDLPGVTLVNVPAEARATIRVPAADGSRFQRWLYLISGDLSLEIESREGSRRATMTENGFLAWRDAAAIASTGHIVSEGGCVALCVGHLLGATPTTLS